MSSEEDSSGEEFLLDLPEVENDEDTAPARRRPRRRQIINDNESDNQNRTDSEYDDEEEQLPSVGDEEEQLPSVGDEEEQLPSVGDEEEVLLDSVNELNEAHLSEEGSDYEELPSVGNEELGVQDSNYTDYRNGERAYASDSELSDDRNAEPRRQVSENNVSVSQAPVSGFRVVVGPDGEETYEFASDSMESSSSDDEDYNPGWIDHVGVEPAVPFQIPNSIVNNIANRILSPARSRRASVNARRSIEDLGRQGVRAPAGTAGPSSSTGNGARTQRRRKATAKKRGKKKSQKKKVSKKPRAPPKPLGPLTIHEEWNGNDDYKTYLKLIQKSTQFRLHINFNPEIPNDNGELSGKLAKPKDGATIVSSIDETEDISKSKPESFGVGEEEEASALEGSSGPQIDYDTFGYKIAQVQFDRCSIHEWRWKSKSELRETFPSILDLTLHVSSQPSASILHLKTKRTLRGSDTSQRVGSPLKLSKRDSARELIFVGTEHFFFHLDPVNFPVDLFNLRALGNRKTFILDFNKFEIETQRFTFDIVLLDSAILGEHEVTEIPTLKSPLMQEVFTNLFGVVHPPSFVEQEAREKEDIDWFYGQIKKYHNKEQLPSSDIPLQPSSLKPTLRKYQRDAVNWMLYREGCLKHCEAHSSSSYQNRVDLIEAFLNKMYVAIELSTPLNRKMEELSFSDKKKAFYNLHTAYVCWKKPNVPQLPSGGILCDEMGLGKTVETLSIILLNQKETPEVYKDFFEGNQDRDAENYDQGDEENASRSDSEESVPTDSDDSSYSSKGRRGKRSKGSKSIKPKKVVSSRAAPKPRFQSTKRRRANSPCEFKVTLSGDEENKATSPERLSPARRRSSRSKNITAMDYVERKLKSIERKRRSAKAQGKEGVSKRPPLFEAMKVLYDSALSEYRYADFARSAPKFHGKFYDVTLELRECFECLCGESDEGCKDWEIVKCSVCSSSQHADCVGFDHELATLFEKLGRSYMCPHCESLNSPFETKSTLIITPPSISHQWIKEIQKHVQNHRLNMLFYKGVSTHGYIPPAKLARYDIVITTYSVLSSELDYVDLPHCNSADGRRLRNPKRFLTIPSPLPNVLWWRVCLDEAQMVEGINTKMSMMAMKFKAVHRWCVTGTPMNKGLQDLFGLFVFLQLQPVASETWWNALVREPFFRKDTDLLYELFGQLIWRNGKQDVLDQLGIPPQTEIVHWLNFSPVETHFYKQQFEICANRIRDKIARLQRNAIGEISNARLSSLDRFSLSGLLAPFLELRQACCHPQVVKGKIINLQKDTSTMEALLERLMKKAQLDCIDLHRIMVGSLNAMAGLFIIQNKFVEAADKYRQVLQSAESYKEHFATDSLQLLHTKENLADILDKNHDGIAFTLRDESLRQDAVELRQKYMKKYSTAMQTAQKVVTPLSNAVEEIQGQFTMLKESWWMAALKAAQRCQKIDGLIQTLKQDLLDVSKKHFQKTQSLASKFHDRYGLEHTIIPILMEMNELRSSVLEGLEELQTNDASVFVESAIPCHLRQSSENYYNDAIREGKCKLCVYHDIFLLYESVIFKMETKDKISRTGRNWQQRKIMGDLADDLEQATKEELLRQEAEDLLATTEHVHLHNTELRRGTWGDSETEVILKGVLRFAKINKLIPDIIENGQVHMKLFDALKKEFRFLRILWRQIYDQVSALDELSQATTRLIAVVDPSQQPSGSSSRFNLQKRSMKQLKTTDAEKAFKLQNINVIGFHEIESKMSQMQSDFQTACAGLPNELGQLIFLKTLKKNGYGKKGTVNTEDCPICSIQLGKQWSVLRCGHSYCSDCVKKMCPNTLHEFSCPLCRHSMKYADVSFVDTTESTSSYNSDDHTPGTSKSSFECKKAREIKGSHSTKVEAIVETLLDVQEKYPGEKCIIFSTWFEVLEIIKKALEENSITHILATQAGRQFHQSLERFKDREDLQVLLLPLTSGSKGLNIIEATHVFLVEPILNLANELQAIGRVHRIGQTKPTFVHRFYIKRTIEENLFQILKSQDISSDEEGCLTVKDLQNLVSSSSSSAQVVTLDA